MTDWIKLLFDNPEMLRMGHLQRAADANLGLGWLYYGLARIIRPRRIVVIGSWRGFTPLVFAKALADNNEGGRVLFLDPSYVDNFWKNPADVTAYFERFGITNIDHRLVTTQEFTGTEEYRALNGIGLLFVDGYHSAGQAEYDYRAFEDRMAAEGLALFHDSVRTRTSRIYGDGRHYDHTVCQFIETLRRQPELQVFDFPYADGVTAVRRSGEATPSS